MSNKTVYDIKCVYAIKWDFNGEDNFVDVDIQPITVVREGILPGCTGVSITAIGPNGKKFLGNPANYYVTKAEAWAEIKKQLIKAVDERREEIKNLQTDINTMTAFLDRLRFYDSEGNPTTQYERNCNIFAEIINGASIAATARKYKLSPGRTSSIVYNLQMVIRRNKLVSDFTGESDCYIYQMRNNARVWLRGLELYKEKT
jgi:Mor family transcriptional regulator